MAYEGYLVKIGDYPVPFKFIKYETFQAVWSVVDFDSYRDANGELHRDSVSDRRTMKVEWETPDLSETEIRELFSNIKAEFTDAKAKSCIVKAWMPEEGVYKEDKCYLTSDVNFTIRSAEEDKTYLHKYPANTPHVTTTPFEIRYNPVRLAFIGYNTNRTTQGGNA